MTQSVAILGRQPALGATELEALYGAQAVRRLGANAALIDKAPEAIDFDRLGGSVKLGKLLTVLGTTAWEDIEAYLLQTIPKHLEYLDGGKLTLGLSALGMKASPKRINATALSIKKVVKETGRACRIIPNATAELSSATVLHNRLFTRNNWELCVIAAGDETYLVQTTDVQDIDAYAARDQARPKRDARVGMLPPKLAQIIVNLAVGNPVDEQHMTTHMPLVFDPFCGTGVILQEALLMDYPACGSDLEPRMVEFAQTNLEWLSDKSRKQLGPLKSLTVADATNATWPDMNMVGAIACETYLGRPFSSLPDPKTLHEVMTDVDTIHRKFLKNLARQSGSGLRMCIAVPAWSTPRGFLRLKTLDHLEELGYTRAVFKNALAGDLIYHREGQVVGRELVVLTRK